MSEPVNEMSGTASGRHLLFFAFCLFLATVCCLLLLMFGSLSDNSLHYAFKGRPLPAGTELCLRYKPGILLFPLPWFVAAWRFGVRGQATAAQLTIFAATLTLSLLCLTVFLAFFYALPWMPLSLC